MSLNENLKVVLLNHFNLQELNTLLFDLGEDYEKFESTNKETKIRDIIGYFTRQRRLETLIEKIRLDRPNLKIEWGPVKDEVFVLSNEYDFFSDLENIIKSTLSWIKQARNIDGGLPTDDKGSKSCTWSTSGLIWAAWYGGSNFEQPWIRKALIWVAENINSDGGIPIVTKGDYSTTDATAQTVIAMCLYLSNHQDEILENCLKGCIDWLIKNRLEDEGWSWRPSDEQSWIASSAYAILSLHYACKLFPNNKSIEDTANETLQWLLSIQNGDGGWGEQEGNFSKIAITGIVTTVLYDIAKIKNEKAMRFILSKQDTQSGSWEEAIDRPNGHTITRFANAYCLNTLVVHDYPLNDIQFIKGFNALLQSYDTLKFRYKNTSMASWITRDALLTLVSLGRRLDVQNIRKPFLH